MSLSHLTTLINRLHTRCDQSDETLVDIRSELANVNYRLGKMMTQLEDLTAKLDLVTADVASVNEKAQAINTEVGVARDTMKQLRDLVAAGQTKAVDLIPVMDRVEQIHAGLAASAESLSGTAATLTESVNAAQASGTPSG